MLVQAIKPKRPPLLFDLPFHKIAVKKPGLVPGFLLPLFNILSIMQRFIQHEYNDDVEMLFQPRQLVITNTILNYNLPGNESVSQDCLPAGYLFSRKTVREVSGGYQLLDNGVPFAFIERTEQGVHWRLYIGEDKQSAVTQHLLVIGDPEMELCELNIIVDVERKANGLFTWHDRSIVNGRPLKDFKPVPRCSGIRLQIALNHLSDPAVLGGKAYLPWAGKNFDQQGTKRPYVNITKENTLPKSTDMVGVSQIDTHADYCMLPIDVNDLNIEQMVFEFVWMVDRSIKNDGENLFINLNEVEGW